MKGRRIGKVEEGWERQGRNFEGMNACMHGRMMGVFVVLVLLIPGSHSLEMSLFE